MSVPRLALVTAALAFAACSPATRPVRVEPRRAPAAAARVDAVRIRSVDRAGLRLRAVAGLPDGGLVVVGSGWGTIQAGATTACVPDQPAMFFARVDAAGVVSSVTCAPGIPEDAMVAASERGVWVARKVDPAAPEHIHGDVYDLLAIDRFSLDGAPIDSRIVAVWKDLQPRTGAGPNYSEAGLAAGNFALRSASVAGDEVVITGASKTAALVHDRWEVHGSDISLHGFVLAVAADGTVRSMFDAADALFEEAAVAGSRYVAIGWCSSSSSSRPPTLPMCGTASTTAIVVDGDVAATAAPRIRSLGSDTFGVHGAIDADGSITVAGYSWRNPLEIDGGYARSKCGPLPFAAGWAPDGTRRFVRALADCDGNHMLTATATATVDGAPTVVVDVEADHGGGPSGAIRFGDLAIDVPYGEDSVVLTLDRAGELVHADRFAYAGTPEGDDQPDASLAPGGGVHAVLPIAAGDRRWLVIHHGGTMIAGGRRFPTAARLRTDDEVGETHFETGRAIHRACTVDMIRKPPGEADSGYVDDEYPCRGRVAVEHVIELLAVPARVD